MKRLLLLITVLCSATIPVWGMEIPKQETQKKDKATSEIQNIFETMQKERLAEIATMAQDKLEQLKNIAEEIPKDAAIEDFGYYLIYGKPYANKKKSVQLAMQGLSQEEQSEINTKIDKLTYEWIQQQLLPVINRRLQSMPQSGASAKGTPIETIISTYRNSIGRFGTAELKSDMNPDELRTNLTKLVDYMHEVTLPFDDFITVALRKGKSPFAGYDEQELQGVLHQFKNTDAYNKTHIETEEWQKQAIPAIQRNLETLMKQALKVMRKDSLKYIEQSQTTDLKATKGTIQRMAEEIPPLIHLMNTNPTDEKISNTQNTLNAYDRNLYLNNGTLVDALWLGADTLLKPEKIQFIKDHLASTLQWIQTDLMPAIDIRLQPTQQSGASAKEKKEDVSRGAPEKAPARQYIEAIEKHFKDYANKKQEEILHIINKITDTEKLQQKLQETNQSLQELPTSTRQDFKKELIKYLPDIFPGSSPDKIMEEFTDDQIKGLMQTVATFVQQISNAIKTAGEKRIKELEKPAAKPTTQTPSTPYSSGEELEKEEYSPGVELEELGTPTPSLMQATTAIAKALKNNDTYQIDKLLKGYPDALRRQILKTHGSLYLDRAAGWNILTLVEYLVKEGAEPWQSTLERAIKNNQTPIVNVLKTARIKQTGKEVSWKELPFFEEIDLGTELTPAQIASHRILKAFRENNAQQAIQEINNAIPGTLDPASPESIQLLKTLVQYARENYDLTMIEALLARGVKPTQEIIDLARKFQFQYEREKRPELTKLFSSILLRLMKAQR